MKKNYFYALFASLMLFMAMPATAQLSQISELFGKYNFTATINTTEAGAAYADMFKNECEVVITKSASQYFMADISGFAGADYSMSVANFNSAKNTFEVSGPNSANYGIWNGYIAVANADGEWPWATNENGQVQFGFTFEFNPESKDITVADFTIVSQNWGTNTATVLATVSNVKMTLVEAEIKDTSKYPDLAGVWTWEGTLRDENNDPKSFTVEFAQAGEGKDLWNATFAFGEYEPFTLEATFDGSMVTIPHDTIFLDRENRIRFGARSSSKQYDGAFTFAYTSKTSMALYDYIYVRRDSISPETGELVGAFVHQVFDGYVTRPNPDAYDWSGTYNVAIPEMELLTDAYGVELPSEFDMVIEKKPGDRYEITKMFGFEDLYIPFTPADDDASATIELGGYSGAMLQFIGSVDGDYAYYVLTDGNGEPTTLTVTKNEDETLSFGDFSISYKLYYAASYDPIYACYGAGAEKEKFDWAGTYVLTADVAVEEGVDTTFPAEFEVEVQLYSDGKYRIVEFMDTNIYNTNQGSTVVEVAENAKSATISLSQSWGVFFVAGSYPNYMTLTDKDGVATSLNVVLGAGNVLKMDDFTVSSFNWDTNASAKLATYSNVTLTKKNDTAIENVAVEKAAVKGIFDMQGRQIEKIVAPGLYIIDGVKVLVK